MKIQKDLCSEYIDKLCRIFRDRGIACSVQQHSEQADARGTAKGEDKSSQKSKKYRTGNSDGVPCMSSEDFARYYNDQRTKDLPDARSRSEEEYKKAANAEFGVELQSKKEMRLAVFKLIGQKLKAGAYPLFRPKQLIEDINNGFDADEPDQRLRTSSKKLPKGSLPVLLLVILSLFLIVCSSVMVSRMESDIARLESKLDQLEEHKDKLDADLEVKNNLIDIRRIAEEEYGMVGAEYVTSKYVYIPRNDGIMVSDHSDRSALIRLLQALGIKSED